MLSHLSWWHMDRLQQDAVDTTSILHSVYFSVSSHFLGMLWQAGKPRCGRKSQLSASNFITAVSVLL